ncbi:hypothetical protein BC940DRAFT_306687 [Gongronella butleri]|nr:hypothetical protein BC940DRAFT_306687 [Gongronella butleri]
MAGLGRICDYSPEKVEKRDITRFCRSVYARRKRPWLVAQFKSHTRWFSMGVAAAVAHAVSQPHHFTRTLLMDTTLWTLGFGLSCYLYLSQVYQGQTQASARAWMHVLQSDQSKAWVSLQEHQQQQHQQHDDNVILGLLVLSIVNDEAQIQVSALNPKIELQLVQTAIAHAHQQGITVIAQDHQRKSNLGPF